MSSEAVPAQEDNELIDLVDGGHVVLVGWPCEPSDAQVLAAVSAKVPGKITVHRPRSSAEARQLLALHPVRVLALGDELTPSDGVELLESLEQEHLGLNPAIVLLGDYEGAVLQRLVQDDLLFYVSGESLNEKPMLDLLAGGFAHAHARFQLDLAALGRSQDLRVTWNRRVLVTAETWAGINGPELLEDPLLEALDETLGVDGARLWVYDPIEQTLRAPGVEGLEVSAVAGITSFVARTGQPVSTERAAEDPRFDFEADEGAEGRLLAVPVKGPEGRVLGVLAIRRNPQEPPLSPDDLRLVERFAQHLAPHLLARVPRPFAIRQRQMSQDPEAPQLFRPQAIDASERDFTDSGRILRNSPGWARWTWSLLLVGFLSALLLMVFGKIHEYAGGPAVVRIGQRVDVTSQLDASVIAVEAQPGARVAVGDALARLYGAAEAAEITNLEDEFEQLLRRRLAAPGDTATEASLVETRTALERARARLAQRVVRSPTAGVVGDVRVRPGQHLSAGELLLSVIADEEVRSVVGLIPGHFGPQLEVGQRLRLTLVGYPDLSLDLEITAVGEEVISPQEARQSLGASIAGTLGVEAPVVLVEGRLGGASFDDGTREWSFRDGMQGVMEIQVRSRPILLHLVPGLERVFRSRQ